MSRHRALLSKLLHVNISPLIEILAKCGSYSSTALNHRAAFSSTFDTQYFPKLVLS